MGEDLWVRNQTLPDGRSLTIYGPEGRPPEPPSVEPSVPTLVATGRIRALLEALERRLTADETRFATVVGPASQDILPPAATYMGALDDPAVWEGIWVHDPAPILVHTLEAPPEEDVPSVYRVAVEETLDLLMAWDAVMAPFSLLVAFEVEGTPLWQRAVAQAAALWSSWLRGQGRPGGILRLKLAAAPKDPGELAEAWDAAAALVWRWARARAAGPEVELRLLPDEARACDLARVNKILGVEESL